MFGAFVIGCDARQPAESQKPLLIQMDGQGVTLKEFDRAFETTRIAYGENCDDEALNPLLLKNARLRMLSQMVQELVVERRASELGISLNDEELTRAVESIKKDYQDNEFEEMLLESAIPFALWEERLRARLLMEKVIKRDLAETVTITAPDIEAYYKAHEAEFAVDSEKPPQDELKHRIVKRLRREKIEAAYPQWIESLRERYQVDVNWELWNGTAASDVKTADQARE